VRAAIIAAGEGSRLASEGAVKPLIPVAGKPLIGWVVEALSKSGCREISVLTNSRGKAVPAYLLSSYPELSFDFVTADTNSSFESFRLMSLRLSEFKAPFAVSTVDALIPPSDVGRFLDECRASKCDAGLALTTYVDDEKPLWADLDEVGLISALGDAAKTKRFVTSGLYYMTPAACAALPAASAHGRLRDFLGSLVASGARVAGPVLSKTLDVDRPEDLRAAETFLTAETKR
jgi:NDP-sugar pyrophosphorylase family protein